MANADSEGEQTMNTMHLEGAAREAIATADLLRRGFEVYGAACGNSSFDLVAYKHGHLLRVEVKGRKKAPRGTGPVGSVSKSSKLDCHKFDILAVIEGNQVWYIRSVLHILNVASEELITAETVNKWTTHKNLARATTLKGDDARTYSAIEVVGTVGIESSSADHVN